MVFELSSPATGLGGDFRFVSAGAAQLGFLPDQQGRYTLEGFLALIHPDDLERVVDRGIACARDLEPYDHIHRLLDREGRVTWVHAKGLPERAPDGSAVVMGTITDITDLQQARQRLAEARDTARAAAGAKGTFLAMLSHEIRTPMNTVLGMSRLAMQTDLEPDQRRRLERIEAASRSLVDVISDVLDFSRIEAGRMVLEHGEFSIEAVLSAVADNLASRAQERGLELVFDVDPAVPGRVVGDAARLGQVIGNLVSNAIRFTDRGEAVVHLDLAAPVGPSGVELRVAVTDTGCGIAAERLEGIFEPFTQARPEEGRAPGGSGLGLAICRTLVEMMDGSISATSTVGHGSTFTFTVRLGRAGSAATHRPVRQLATARVLIVDDSASARLALATMVGTFGARVDHCASGEEGLVALRAASAADDPFDVVLMDWRMPGMDGLEAARRITEDTRISHTPAVLMVTAFGRDAIVARAHELGLWGVLTKPVTASLMLNTLSDVLGAPLGVPASTGGPPAAVQPIGRRALVVDDDALSREMVAGMLERVGMVVATAGDGATALRAAAAVPGPEVIVLDARLPDMDGPEVARRLRREPGHRHTPIIALTGHTGPDARARSLAAGMDEHLEKPVEPGVLCRAVVGLLGQVEARIDLRNLCVLVVDDDPLCRERAAQVLEDAGAAVLTATDGWQALEVLGRRRVGAVLMDVHMPGIDGLATTRAVIGDPATAHIPVIAVTAQAETAERQASLDAGAVDHLAKPFDDGELLMAVARATGRSPAGPGAARSASPPASEEGDDGEAAAMLLALGRVGGGPARARRLAGAFADDAGADADRLRRAWAADDLPVVAAIAHTLKGSAGYLGATRLAALAGQLHDDARHRPDGLSGEAIDALAGELERVVRCAARVAGGGLAVEDGAPPALPRPRADDEPQELAEQVRQAADAGEYSTGALLERLAAVLPAELDGGLLDRARAHFAAGRLADVAQIAIQLGHRLSAGGR